MMGLSLYDVPEVIASVTIEEVSRALQEGFAPEARAISIVEPNAR